MKSKGVANRGKCVRLLSSLVTTTHSVALFLTLASCANAFPQSQSRFVDLVKRSGFIFQGTVKAMGKSTPTVVPESNTAIVSVDVVLEALPPAGNATSYDVTVRLRNPNVVRVGQSATFFTYVYSAGKSLGLEEVEILPVRNSKELEDEIRQARQALADEALSKRLQSAQLVVVGVVGEAKPTAEALNPRSEHDPLWWRAPLTVRTVEKGRSGTRAVIINIATNYDYLWALAPKPKAGDTGIFLLQSDPEKRSRSVGLFLVDQLDALPLSELERVRRLLKSHP